MNIKNFFFVLFLLMSVASVKAQTGFPFANDVKNFKKADSLNMPKPNGILFLGSSSITLWDDLEQRFADKPIIKRGLGGSQLVQWVQYFSPYVVYPYQPKKIFIYAGENDIAAGRTPQQVVDDFETFWKMLRTNVPSATIYYLSIKSSPSRSTLLNKFAAVNARIKQSIKRKKNTQFIDVNETILNERTLLPDSSLFKSDYLHLNSKGYDKWQRKLNKYVK